MLGSDNWAIWSLREIAEHSVIISFEGILKLLHMSAYGSLSLLTSTRYRTQDTHLSSTYSASSGDIRPFRADPGRLRPYRDMVAVVSRDGDGRETSGETMAAVESVLFERKACEAKPKSVVPPKRRSRSRDVTGPLAPVRQFREPLQPVFTSPFTITTSFGHPKHSALLFQRTYLFIQISSVLRPQRPPWTRLDPLPAGFQATAFEYFSGRRPRCNWLLWKAWLWKTVQVFFRQPWPIMFA